MVDRDTVRDNSGPLGHSTGAARRRRAAASPEYRRAYDALAVARHVASQVLEYRLDRGSTQQQLAELIGTSVPQISRIESGIHNPTLQTLQRLAEVMGKRLTVSFVDLPVQEDKASMEAVPSIMTQEVTTIIVGHEHNRLTVAEQDAGAVSTLDLDRGMTGRMPSG